MRSTVEVLDANRIFKMTEIDELSMLEIREDFRVPLPPTPPPKPLACAGSSEFQLK